MKKQKSLRRIYSDDKGNIKKILRDGMAWSSKILTSNTATVLRKERNYKKMGGERERERERIVC